MFFFLKKALGEAVLVVRCVDKWLCRAQLAAGNGGSCDLIIPDVMLQPRRLAGSDLLYCQADPGPPRVPFADLPLDANFHSG